MLNLCTTEASYAFIRFAHTGVHSKIRGGEEPRSPVVFLDLIGKEERQ